MHKILFYPVFLIPFFAKSQQITIIDKSSREPLPNVIIADYNGKHTETNNKGQFDLSTLNNNDSLSIIHTGYYSKKILLPDATVQTIELTTKLIELQEVVFTPNKTAESSIAVPFKIETIGSKQIEFANQPTTAELLQNTGSIFVQKSQMGGGSPVLRGFEANKTLIVVDGVRMNNAIYRGGHLQDIITLDANMLEKAEVQFGPSSTIYGSDALGGVMNFYTKNAQFSSTDKMLVKVNTMARYASANNERTGHVDFNLGWNRIALLTNITYSQFDDLRSGSTKLTGYTNAWDRNFYVQRFNNKDSMVANPDNNVQKGSAYNQVDLMQRAFIKTGAYLTHNLNFQLSQSSDIPRYDRLTESSSGKLKYAEWYYGPQKRQLGAYTLNYSKKNFLTDDVKVILAYQKINQDRISRRFQNAVRTSQNEEVTVLSANIDAFKKLKQNQELHYGVELTDNNVTSTAFSRNITTGLETPAATRYADGKNQMSTLAGYLSHTFPVNENFIVSSGIRYTYNKLSSEFKDKTFFDFPFQIVKQKNQAVTGSIGFTWKENDNYKLYLTANTGFRTPNIDDMSKVFESNNSILIVPNPDIKPEYLYNIEMGLVKVFQKKFKLEVIGFYSILENALVQRDYRFNGQDSILYNGAISKIQAMQNANRAYIYGLTANVQFDLNDHVSFKSSFNYTYGRYIDTQMDSVVALDHIPPVFGQTSIIARAKRFDGEFFVRYNGKKGLSDHSPSGEDNLQYATPSGMPAWLTLNIRLGYSFTKNFRLNLACENITDNRYRVFASGINAPGRNFIISLRYKI